MAPQTRPRARGRGRAPGTNPMPGAGGVGRNKGVDPGYSGPPRPGNPAAKGSNGGTSAPPAGGPGGRGRRGGRGNPQGGKGGLGEGQLVGPGGRQLTAKVKAGTITGAQAKRTLGQRQTLAKALGPNWRDKLTVGGKSFAQVNKQLKANPKNAKLAALRKKLVTNRSKELEAARAKLKGGGKEGAGDEADGGKKGKGKRRKGAAGEGQE